MQNPFKKFFSSINIGDGGGESAVGIDIGSSSIKVVEIKKKGGRAMLETYGAISLGPYAEQTIGSVTNLSSEKLAEALQEVLKQSSITNTNIALALPVQSSLIFSIELPADFRDKEMTSIISMEARKYIPIPITEVSLDYFILPHREPSFEELNSAESKLSHGKENILVVATQNDIITKFRALTSAAKLSPAFLEIEIFSSVRANFEHELSLVLLMDFGASRTKLSLVEFGVVKSYHSVNRGSADISQSIATSLGVSFVEAEKMKKEIGLFSSGASEDVADICRVHLDHVFSEANSVLLAHERKFSTTVSKVILTGGGALLKGLKERAEDNFRVEVIVGAPFSKVGAPAFLEKMLSNIGPEFAVSLGVALRKLQ